MSPWQKWKRFWAVLYRESPCSMARLELHEGSERPRRAEGGRRLVRLRDCVHVAEATAEGTACPKDTVPFLLETTERRFLLAAEGAEAAEWIQRLCELAFPVCAGKRVWGGIRWDGWDPWMGWVGSAGMGGIHWDGWDTLGSVGCTGMGGIHWDQWNALGCVGCTGMDGICWDGWDLLHWDGWDPSGWVEPTGINGIHWDGWDPLGSMGCTGMGGIHQVQ